MLQLRLLLRQLPNATALDLRRLPDVGLVQLFVVWLLMSTIFCRGAMAVVCYECLGLYSSNCGPLFRPAAFSPVTCRPDVAVCALQRQAAIPKENQLAAISRTCYTPGTLPGLDSSVGCRTWTNADNFTALYCFCATDLCNSAISSRRPAPQQRSEVILLQLLLPWLLLQTAVVCS
jgi:hypothetical protein